MHIYCTHTYTFIQTYIHIYIYIYIYMYISVATLAYFCYSCSPRPLSTSVPNPWSVDPK